VFKFLFWCSVHYSLRDQLTNHGHWRFHPQALFDDSTQIRHVVQHLYRHRLLVITPSDLLLFFSHLGKHVGMIGEVLECVNYAAAHGVLGSEQERKEDHGHFSIAEVLPAAFVFRVFDGQDPPVEHALGFGIVLHGDLAPTCGELEPAHGDLARLAGFPYFGAGKGEGKVDQLEGVGDGPVLIVDFLRGTIGDVGAAKNAQGSVYVHVPGTHHNSLRRVGGGSSLEPTGKMFPDHTVLDADVNPEGW
jgi:hypothetical protein